MAKPAKKKAVKQKAPGKPDPILQKLQQYAENDLTKEFLVPLLRKMKYDRVEFYGGPYEGGKDIICWTTDELGKTELAVAQVKMYKPSARASDGKAFSEIVNQLQSASEKAVPHVDGTQQVPSTVYFITPYQVDTRALETRFEAYSLVRRNGLKIIDGPLLAKLVRQYLPEIVPGLIGIEHALQTSMADKLTNRDLLRALGVEEPRKISSFYCDLDFIVGSATSSFFLIPQVSGTTEVELTKKEWNQFKPICMKAEEVFAASFLDQTYEELEKQHSTHLKERKSLISSIEDLGKRNLAITKKFNDVDSTLQNIVRTLKALSQKEDVDVSKLQSNIKIEIREIEKISLHDSGRKAHIIDHREVLNGLLESFRDLELKYLNSEKCTKQLAKYSDELKDVAKNRERILDYELRVAQPPFSFHIDSDALTLSIRSKKVWFEELCRSITSEGLSTTQLLDHLNEIHRVLSITDDMSRNPVFRKALKMPEEQRYSNAGKLPRITLSLHDAFDTRKHMLLLGEAGAGKTTSLQMYAIKNLKEERDQRKTIFVPLSLVIGALEREDHEFSSTEPLRSLESGISIYMKDAGIDISIDELAETFTKEHISLLLDGFDEAIQRADWLPVAMTQLTQQYPRMQLIVSSRTSTEYLDQLSFLGLTLMPFTKEQLTMFLKGWFQDSDLNYSKTVLDHVASHPPMAEALNSPLSATILCVLAENDVPLPDTEPRLYEERMTLLLGVYDMHKKAYRLCSQRQDLLTVARAIAFVLHSRRLRFAEMESIIVWASDYLRNKVSMELVIRATNELFDPCNVLVPMSEEGHVGFGHLRFQEYLASATITMDRSIRITKLMYDPWWRGAMIFFSQNTTDLASILQHVADNGEIYKARETLKAMIATQPNNDQIDLERSLAQYSIEAREFSIANVFLSEEPTDQDLELIELEDELEDS